jgi:hypothetical protein
MIAGTKLRRKIEVIERGERRVEESKMTIRRKGGERREESRKN